MPSDRKLRWPQFTRRATLQGLATLGLGGEAVLGSRAFANALRLGEPAPPATLVTLDGKRLSTSELLGQVVILTFWATWGVPCREELPLLSAYFSLDTPDQLSQVRAVAQQLSFPVGLINAASAPGYGRIWRVPVNFTIGRDGRLVDDGWKDKKPVWTRERLERIVTPLLAATT